MTNVISTVEALEELDWEVPGMPEFNALVEKLEADGDSKEDAIDAIREIFSDFNSVLLDDEALECFNSAVEDYYGEN